MESQLPIIIAARSNKSARQLISFCHQRLIGVYTTCSALLAALEGHPDAVLVTDLLIQDDCAEGILQKAVVTRNIYSIVCIQNTFSTCSILDIYRSGASKICSISELSHLTHWLQVLPSGATGTGINEMVFPHFLIMNPPSLSPKQNTTARQRQVTFIGSQALCSFSNAVKTIAPNPFLSLVVQRPESSWCFEQFRTELENHFLWSTHLDVTPETTHGVSLIQDIESLNLDEEKEHWIVVHGALSEKEQTFIQKNANIAYCFHTTMNGYSYYTEDGSDQVIPSAVFWDDMRNTDFLCDKAS